MVFSPHLRVCDLVRPSVEPFGRPKVVKGVVGLQNEGTAKVGRRRVSNAKDSRGRQCVEDNTRTTMTTRAHLEQEEDRDGVDHDRNRVGVTIDDERDDRRDRGRDDDVFSYPVEKLDRCSPHQARCKALLRRAGVVLNRECPLARRDAAWRRG